MKRIRRIVSVALLLGLVATGGWTFNCLASEPASGETKGVVTVTMAEPCDLMFSDVHQQRYLTYLVKEFEPEALPDWEKAFAERKLVSEKFKLMVKSGPVEITLSEGNTIKKGVVKIESETVESNGDKVFSINCKGSVDGDQMNARIQLQKEFESAVENDDPAAIMTVLPKVLAEYQQATDDMLKAVESQNN